MPLLKTLCAHMYHLHVCKGIKERNVNDHKRVHTSLTKVKIEVLKKEIQDRLVALSQLPFLVLETPALFFQHFNIFI